ncbi:unnamed protein product [Echinostoma caproni]|uniref:RAB3GAP2_C domain-containing protein n=1 Tax=Echinostoma caproni TaxID=27848 RepID=A0A183AT92_9TREM|nr:unnamed protein product [Echinostoma caproni]
MYPASAESDMGLDNRRRLFITWLIDRSVQSYAESYKAHAMRADRRSQSPSSDSVESQMSSGRASHHSPGRHTYNTLDVYTLFTNAATILARHWGFSRDTVLIQHVIALFEANLDDQAELYLPQVEATGNLAARLLIVVGRRLAWYCFGSQNPEGVSYQLSLRACIPFDLESWLRGLQSDNSSASFRSITNNRDLASEFDRLVPLIDYVVEHIPHQASQMHIAEAMRDAIHAMHEMD